VITALVDLRIFVVLELTDLAQNAAALVLPTRKGVLNVLVDLRIHVELEVTELAVHAMVKASWTRKVVRCVQHRGHVELDSTQQERNAPVAIHRIHRSAQRTSVSVQQEEHLLAALIARCMVLTYVIVVQAVWS
jgi:hypothetical protein